MGPYLNKEYMLPFLNRKDDKQSGSVVSSVSAPEDSVNLHEEGLKAAGQELMEAINSQDHNKLISSIRAIIEIIKMEER